MKRLEALTLLLALFAGAILAFLLGKWVLIGFGLESVSPEMIHENAEANVGRALLLYQLLSGLCSIGVPAVFILFRWKKNDVVPFIPSKSWSWRSSMYSWCLLPLALPFLSWATDIWMDTTSHWSILSSHRQSMEISYRSVDKMLQVESLLDQFLGVLTFVFSAAITEELLFRGVFLRLFYKKKVPIVAILLSSLLFALAHMNLFQLPFLVGAGLILGFLYWISGRLWVPIIAHILHNGFIYVLSTSGQSHYGGFDNASIPVAFVLSSTLAFGYIFYRLWTTRYNEP